MRFLADGSARPWQLPAAVLAVWLLIGLVTAAFAESATPTLEAFFGTFKGQTILESDGAMTTRDLDVAIAPTRTGFNIRWTTTTLGRDGALKRESSSIDFEPTRRTGIFASQMRSDMFGNRVPLDPLRGDPFVWARQIDATLTVYALLITDDGGYEMQVYHRTLAEDGLTLRFFRFREGDALRTVTASLKRTKS
ncbi:MAG: hypothetical protein P9C48_12035 [Defluviicoccus sp.]|nr:hypothetical protein [Defluviicoccus sp.]MDG4609848.1 hypothetical protein [Defluviicoccus sp.]